MSPPQFSARITARSSATPEAQGRIAKVDYEPAVPVHTAWDLGISDSTAIRLWQAVASEIRVIDFYEDHGKALPHYAKVLHAKGYKYGRDHLVPDHKVGDGINAVRQILPLCRRQANVPRKGQGLAFYGFDGRPDRNPRGDHCRSDHRCDEGNGHHQNGDGGAHAHSLQRSTENPFFLPE
jgi:hypothetical protein